jgi:hypothetical protein
MILLRRTEQDALDHILPYISQPMPCVNSDPVQFVKVDFHQPPNDTNVLDLLSFDNVQRCAQSPPHVLPLTVHEWTSLCCHETLDACFRFASLNSESIRIHYRASCIVF